MAVVVVAWVLLSISLRIVQKSYAAVVDFCQGHVVGHRLIVTRVTTL